MADADLNSLTTDVLLTGIALGESPRWHGGKLWFSDWLAHELCTVDSGGRREVVLTVAGLPFCFDWLPEPDGRLLVVCNHGGRRLLRREADGTLAIHADLSPLADQPWNEVVVDGRGNAYVNSIGFDLMAGAPPAPGIIVLVTPDGRARPVAGDLQFPNGMAVTPDNRTLIVAESYAQRLTAYDIDPADGGLTNRRTWAEVDGYPDGICLDADGAVWCAAMLRCLRIADGGEVLDTVELDRSAFACALGGPDGRTLFVMAAEWHGTEGVDQPVPTGQVVTARAPAPHAGRP